MFGKYGTIETILPSDNDVIEITRKKREKEPYPGYTLFGNGKETKKGGKSMDILDICKDLGKPEMTLMQFLRDEMEKNKMNKVEEPNIIIPASSDGYTEYVKTILKKHYAHMECLGIMKRMKRGTYMINPFLFIPTRNMESMADMWNNIKEDCKDKA